MSIEHTFGEFAPDHIDLDLRRDQLQRVRVTSDNDHVQLLRFRLHSKGRQDVVSFETGRGVDGNAKCPANVLRALQLDDQIIRRCFTLRLVRSVLFMTKGAPDIKSQRHIVRAKVVPSFEQRGSKAKGGVGWLAARAR